MQIFTPALPAREEKCPSLATLLASIVTAVVKVRVCFFFPPFFFPPCEFLREYNIKYKKEESSKFYDPVTLNSFSFSQYIWLQLGSIS